MSVKVVRQSDRTKQAVVAELEGLLGKGLLICTPPLGRTGRPVVHWASWTGRGSLRLVATGALAQRAYLPAALLAAARMLVRHGRAPAVKADKRGPKGLKEVSP